MARQVKGNRGSNWSDSSLIEQPPCAPVPREPATQLCGGGDARCELATRKPMLGRSHRCDTSAFVRGGKSGACDAVRIAIAQLPQRGESVGGHRARSAATPSQQRTHGGQETTSHPKVSQRRPMPISHSRGGRGLRFRRKKLIANQTFRNSLACRFHQFLSEHVGSCTLFPRLVTLSCIGRPQILRQPDPWEVHIAVAHRGFFCCNRAGELGVLTLPDEAFNAAELRIEAAHAADLRRRLATLASKHVDAGRQPRAGVRTPAPAFQSALSRRDASRHLLVQVLLESGKHLPDLLSLTQIGERIRDRVAVLQA